MDEVASGYYKDKNPEFESQRQAIFDAFMRGIYAFVKQYDKENPEKPLQEVAVGWTYNRLKKQCAEFSSIAPLRVPSEYNFSDAKQVQHLLYNRLTDLNKLTQEQSLEQN